jgi:sialate O-acetylesterase
MMAVWACVLTGLVLLTASPAAADVRMPRVLSDHMVLQCGVPLPVWGWAGAGEEVTVKLGQNEAKATADAAGKWMVKLPALEAGGPLEMTVTGKNTIRITDILVGEVWLCSGQSNMEFGLNGTDNGAQAVAEANYPQMRLFHVQKATSGQPVQDVTAAWAVCSPQTAGGFTAVGYFFGREIHKALNVPVGLINSSWGGTRIEPWTPPEGFAAVPKVEGIAKQIEQANQQYVAALPPSLDALEAWIPAARKALAAGAPVPPMPAVAQHAMNNSGQPTGLYNAMIYPLVPFAIRGALWYQGESNCGEGMLYYEKMKALIGGWRQLWGEGDFPFYYVQLAPYRYGPDATKLPGIWEAQVATLSVPNTGMAVTTDIVGNVGDIHPRNKVDVGKRLSLWALAKTYKRDGIVYSGPLYKAMEVGLNEITVEFDQVGGGLASRDGQPLTCFEIAGKDGKFAPAQARIEGNTVVVSAKEVAEPESVRFAWTQDAQPNLMNKEGLPASPFRAGKQ